MIEDTSSEFDMFEDVRRKLTELLLRAGREVRPYTQPVAHTC